MCGPMKTTLRVFAYVRRYPWMASGMLACAVLTTLMVVVSPLRPEGERQKTV